MQIVALKEIWKYPTIKNRQALCNMLIHEHGLEEAKRILEKHYGYTGACPTTNKKGWKNGNARF